MLSRRSRALLLASARLARPASSACALLRPSLAAAALHAQAQSEARSPWSAAAWAAAGALVAGGALLLPERAACEGPSTGGLVSHEAKILAFYEYERRLRAHSSADKVSWPVPSRAPPALTSSQIFEYFASTKRGDAPVMLPLDLLRAVHPVFPAYGSSSLRMGALPGEPRTAAHVAPPPQALAFFKSWDHDTEGALSYGDYILFSTLLTIPLHDVEAAFRMFDEDQNGSLDAQEFTAMMRVLRTLTRQGASAGPARTGGLSAAEASEASLDDASVSAAFFGKNGKQVLTLKAFKAFMQSLAAAMTALEFAHYDGDGDGRLTPADFGLSLVAGVPVHTLPEFLGRVAKLEKAVHTPKAAVPHITLAEFQAFKALLPQLTKLRAAVTAFDAHHGELSRPALERALKRVCGIVLAPTVLDVLFCVFDADGDGSLSVAEFFDVMERNENVMAANRRPAVSGGGLGEATRLMASCTKECAREAMLKMRGE